jgi:hypothetical protein
VGVYQFPFTAHSLSFKGDIPVLSFSGKVRIDWPHNSIIEFCELLPIGSFSVDGVPVSVPERWLLFGTKKEGVVNLQTESRVDGVSSCNV